MSAPRPTAILISGRGSNMQALVRGSLSASDGPAPYAVRCVISNLPDAAGLAWAQDQGIETAVVDHRDFGRDRPAFETALQAQLDRFAVDLVALAGFMRLLTGGMVNRWLGRMVNIHPSLLPAFKGLDTHARTLAAGVRITGCTAHFVVPEMDAGPIIAQAAVPVAVDDSEDRLAERVLAAEHRIYPFALSAVAAGACRLENGRAVWNEERTAALGYRINGTDCAKTAVFWPRSNT